MSSLPRGPLFAISKHSAESAPMTAAPPVASRLASVGHKMHILHGLTPDRSETIVSVSSVSTCPECRQLLAVYLAASSDIALKSDVARLLRREWYLSRIREFGPCTDQAADRVRELVIEECVFFEEFGKSRSLRIECAEPEPLAYEDFFSDRPTPEYALGLLRFAGIVAATILLLILLAIAFVPSDLLHLQPGVR